MLKRGLSDAWRAIAICLFYDTSVAALALFLAIAARNSFGGDLPDAPSFLPLAIALCLSTAAAIILTGVFRHVWRHSTTIDLQRVAQAAVLANLIFVPVAFLSRQLSPPLFVIILIEAPLLIGFMIAGRVFSRSRATGQLFSGFRTSQSDRPYAILVGEAARLAETLASLKQTPEGLPVQPLGIIETSGLHLGRAINGVQVLGDISKLDYFMSVLKTRYTKPPWIALVGRPNDRVTMDVILDVSSKHGATVQRLRRESDMGVEPVRPNDLLTRLERRLDETLVSNLISGSRVFVTGAGGTIGSEMVRQCAALGPAEITLFDASEYNLYEIDMRLKEMFPHVQRRAVLGDVRDEIRLEEAMMNARPQVVIHAAALKHVPLMELNPNEAILTNIEGARLVATHAAKTGAESFVFISTDKAVNPANVMGASKRAAELFIQGFAPTQTRTRFSMVRFGNVLGSAGSVAPLFERQIDAGGPVTVTHRDMTRYFMSVEEAAALVLQAAALSDRERQSQANLFVLDMGEPVRIEELARRMIRLKGLRPEENIRIEYSGLRPGEKLNEVVFYSDEQVEKTEIDGVLRAETSQPDLEKLQTALDLLIDAARQRETRRARKLLSDLSPEMSAIVSDSDQAPDSPETSAKASASQDSNRGGD